VVSITPADKRQIAAAGSGSGTASAPRRTAAPARRTGLEADLDRPYRAGMIKFLLWLLLFVVSWPLALLALVLWPLVWLLSLPFRLVGVAVGSVFELLRAVLTLPARLLGSRA
jgi:hypothetical protein